MDETRARELLVRERKRIEEQLQNLARDDADELANEDQHQADDAAHLHEDQLDDGIALRLEEELAAVNRAEQRLEEGTYGLSIESSEPIPDARLEAVPWAERTVAEQEVYDARG